MADKFIEGVDGREPVGAVVSIGKKNASGYPHETDRWHIVQPHENNGIREPHPAFAGFNQARPDQRKVIRGNLVHAQRDDCFEYYLRNQSNKQVGMHPDKRPFCTGNGKTAERWAGDDPDNFMDIKCPHDRCEYRLTNPPQCKPFARFLFRLRWKDDSPLPTPLVKFTTGSWNTVQNLVGFFKYIEKVARGLGIKDPSLFGFPFMLTLTRQTKPSAKTAFPVVTVAPEQDPVEFFAGQRAKLLAMQEAPLALEDMQEPDQVAADYESVNVPRITSTEGK